MRLLLAKEIWLRSDVAVHILNGDDARLLWDSPAADVFVNAPLWCVRKYYLRVLTSQHLSAGEWKITRVLNVSVVRFTWDLVFIMPLNVRYSNRYVQLHSFQEELSIYVIVSLRWVDVSFNT